jgi:hypothetical protein
VPKNDLSGKRDDEFYAVCARDQAKRGTKPQPQAGVVMISEPASRKKILLSVHQQDLHVPSTRFPQRAGVIG